MPTKTGGGGSINENYDPNTGKYVANSGYSDSDIENDIINGMFGDDIKNVYNSLDADGQSEMKKEIKKALDDEKTKSKMNERFKESNIDFFFKYGNAVDQRDETKYPYIDNSLCSNKQNSTSDELKAIHDYIIGAGNLCFEFEHGLRVDDFSVLENKYGLDRSTVEENIEKIDSLIAKNPLQEDVTVFRAVNNDYMANTFKEELQAAGVQFFKNQYGRDDCNLTVDELYKVLKGNIEGNIIQDDAYMSVSFDKNWSHWIPKDINVPGYYGPKGNKTYRMFDSTKDARQIVMKMAIPKGTGCYLSQNAPESEGVLPRGLKTFIQSVELEDMEHLDGKHVEGVSNKFNVRRLVIYYGIAKE